MAIAIGAAVVIIACAIGLALLPSGPSTSDTAADANLAALRQQQSARRAKAARAGTLGEMADRIRQTNSDRKSEQRSLTESE